MSTIQVKPCGVATCLPGSSPLRTRRLTVCSDTPRLLAASEMVTCIFWTPGFGYPIGYLSRALEKCTTRAERLCTTMGFTGETAAVARTAEVEDEVEIDGWLVNKSWRRRWVKPRSPKDA